MADVRPDAAQRAVLARLADVLVAEADGMPAASAVGVAGDLLDRCLAAAPVLAAPLLALLDEAPHRASVESGAPGAPVDSGASVSPGASGASGMSDAPVDSGASEAFVRELAANRPDDFAVLSTAVVGAYYLSPQVRDLIGYPGQEPSPLSVAGELDYLDMLERVCERHPGYRHCP